MRILSVNYRYFVSGGPESYMFSIADMLRGASHEIIPFSVRYSRNRETPWSEYFADPIAGDDEVYFRDHSWSPRVAMRSLQRAFFAPDVYDDLRRLLDVALPDVAFVQHYLRKLSPSVLVALKDARVPIIVRLSDYAMVCPGATMLRDGQVCRLCVTKGLTAAIRHRCVQNSAPASIVGCLSMWFARWRGYFDLIDCFVSPSAIMRDEMISGGYDGSRIVVLPTFVQSDLYRLGGTRARRIVYVGRLSPEKGLETLLDAYGQILRRGRSANIELCLAGDGESDYQASLEAKAKSISPSVRFLGRLEESAVRELLCTSLVSVVPSLCYENLPNTVLESLAAGTPVVASDLGSMREVLVNTQAGLLFPAGDAEGLANCLTSLVDAPERLEKMSHAARLLAETRYSPDVHLAGLLELFERVGSHNRRKRGF
jgi:glycosyltransferase involved in cell wall biosynthesis